MKIAIDIKSIYKKYDKVSALQDVSLEVFEGEIFGLIGADGSGKTSLFRILTTLILPDQGEAKVQGWDIVKDYRKIREIVGYMPGRFALYQDLSVEENLSFFATLFGTTIQENYNQIADIYKQIEPFKERRAGKLSGGMKQKLALCCALVHRPTVLFLDEPTTGVDPVSRKEFWAMLKRLKEQGITIMVSTPYMDEAAMCDRIALIEKGHILQIDTPDGLIEKYAQNLWAISSNRMYKLLTDLRNYTFVTSCYAFGDRHHITTKYGFEAEKLINYLTELGHNDILLNMIEPTIEDCYIKALKQ